MKKYTFILVGILLSLLRTSIQAQEVVSSIKSTESIQNLGPTGVVVTWPIDRSIFQATPNHATVWFSGQFKLYSNPPNAL